MTYEGWALILLFIALIVALSATRARLRQSEAALQSQLQASPSLQDQLTEQANRDPLTGLYNRRYLTTALQRETDACAREGATLALLLIDLDLFKQINDRHGHAAGDDVLCQISALLLQSMRPSDICCRYGGEEFLLVLPGMGLQTAVERAQALRQQVAERRWLADGQPIGVTLSVGVACAHNARVAPAALISAIDSRTAVPADITSSTISTRPCSGAPTRLPPSPWSLASLRL